MVRMRDIAKTCDVSKSTVSLAFNKPHLLAKETKEKILAVARETGYITKHKHKFNNIALVMHNFAAQYGDTYYNEVLKGIFLSSITGGKNLRLFDSFDISFEEIYDYDGIIFVGDTALEVIDKALSFHIPFVVCGHPLPTKKDIYTIHFNIRDGFIKIIDYLQASGHSRIGLIIGSFPKENTIGNIITATYRQQISQNQQSLHSVEYADLDTLTIALNKLISQKKPPTAIIFADDYLCFQGYKILQSFGLKIPQDISITGFDGIRPPVYLALAQPELTTIATDQQRLGQCSLELLQDIITSGPLAKTKEHVLSIALRIGKTVRRIS